MHITLIWSRSQTSVHHFLKSRTFTFLFRIFVHHYVGKSTFFNLPNFLNQNNWSFSSYFTIFNFLYGKTFWKLKFRFSKKVTKFDLIFQLANTKSMWKNDSNLNFLWIGLICSGKQKAKAFRSWGCWVCHGRSVSPISTKGGRLCPPKNTGTPGFSNLPTALRPVYPALRRIVIYWKQM